MVKKERVNDDALRRAHDKGMSLGEAAKVLGMKPQGVSYRWRVMGLKPHGKRRLPIAQRTVAATYKVRPSVIQMINLLAQKLKTTKSEVIAEAVKLMVEKHKLTGKKQEDEP